MTHLLRRLFSRERFHSPARTSLGVQLLEDRSLPAAALGPAVDVTGVNYGGQYLEGERTVARADNGNYAIVWEGVGASGDGVYVRLFNAAGGTLSGPQKIAGTSLAQDSKATVAMAGNGQFVVAWEHDFNDNGTDIDVRAQRFDAAGNAVGGVQWIAASGAADEGSPSVGMDAVGNFAVAYSYSSGGPSDVRVNRYNAAGAMLQEIVVAANPNRAEFNPSLDMNPSGQFAVAYTYNWNAPATDPDWDVRAALYTAGGTLISTTVISQTLLQEGDASVAIDAAGNYVVAYTRFEQTAQPPFFFPIITSSEVFAQRVSAAGVKQGGSIAVGLSNGQFESDPSVDITLDGRFVIVFTYDESSSGTNIYGQQFSAIGIPSATFAVTSTSYDEYRPSVAVDANAQFVVAFQTYGLKQTGPIEFPDDYSVSGRRYSW